MVTIANYVNEEPVLTLNGGTAFDFLLTFYEVVRSSSEGVTFTDIRGSLYDFTNWTAFYASLTSERAPGVVKPCAVVLDGPGPNGTLRLIGTSGQTQDLQDAGVWSGGIDVVGQNPAGQRQLIKKFRWTLRRGYTSPSVGSFPDPALLP